MINSIWKGKHGADPYLVKDYRLGDGEWLKRGRKEKDNWKKQTATEISGEERIPLLHFLRDNAEPKYFQDSNVYRG